MTPTVLLETDSFLTINKPAGYVVNDSSTAHGNPTVQDWIDKNYSFELAHNGQLRNGIVHRLDKETSGVLLIAKNKDALESLQSQFKTRETQKKYTALVHDKLIGGGVITATIARNPINKTRFSVIPGGREATTEYKVISYIKKEGKEFSLLEVSPKTGRTHQIRVHLSHIHHPIVSDSLYSGRKTLKHDLAWCPRMFLHAKSLTFKDPKTHEAITVEAALPSDLSSAVS